MCRANLIAGTFPVNNRRPLRELRQTHEINFVSMKQRGSFRAWSVRPDELRRKRKKSHSAGVLTMWFATTNCRRRTRREARPRHSAARLLRLEGRDVPGFLAPVQFSVMNNPQAVTTADFNRDGSLDLVVAQSNATWSVLLGRGDSSFAPASSFVLGGPGVPANVDSVAVGDLNDD